MARFINILTKEEVQANFPAILSVIEQGGAVSLKSAKRRLPQAIIVAVVRDGQDIVGVGTIKRKRPKYAAKIAERSGFTFDQNTHEIGYIAVAESYRRKGMSHQIIGKLLSAFGGGAVFATTSCVVMKKTLKAAGFVQRGEEWQGKNGVLLSLWIRDGDRPNGSD
jgi:hypothetical protein